MRRINSLSDLLMEELADSLSAENQLAEALPQMAQASQSSVLKNALGDCIRVTKDHIQRIQGIFSNIGQNPQRIICQTMHGFIIESEDVVDKTHKGLLGDADIISLLQRVQHYEIARYKTVCEHAANLGHTMIVELFTKTLNEERALNFNFNELVQGMINAEVMESHPPRFDQGGLKKKIKNTEVSRFISEGNPNTQDPPTSNSSGI